MKNLRKVLAMVLAFACTFTMFASAVVFEDVPAGSEFSEAITMLSDLKIIQGKDDGKYHPDDTITRAEACALIARMLTGDPNVNQYVGAANFSDVQKGSWKDSAIGYCVTNGIAVGVGNGKFEPDRPITDAEFVTLLVRAMGYETPGMSYPYGHMSAAQANGLLEGTSMQVGTDALRGEDAQALYNAMFADYAKGAKTINTTHGSTIETYPTIAESVWGLSRAAIGTYDKKDNTDSATLVNCKAHTWVIVGPGSDKGKILAYPIQDDQQDLFNTKEFDKDSKNAYDVFEFKYDGDISGLVGYRVELWGEGSHGSPTWEKADSKDSSKYVYSDNWEIKAIKTIKGQSHYDYNASMADSKSDNGEIVLEDKTLGLGKAADNAKNIQKSDVNADLSVYLHDSYHQKDDKSNSKLTDKDVEKALNVRDGAQYKLMDWDSDGTIDWVVINEANYYRVESASSKRVTVTAMKKAGTSWETSKDYEKVTWKLDEANALSKGVEINYEVPEGLKEGDILEVTYTFDGKKGNIKGTATTLDANSKSLDKVSTKGGLELTFDDEIIYVAENVEAGDVIVPANPSTYKGFNSEELGVDFDLYQNRNGFIVYSDYTTERAAYAMVLDAASGNDTVSNRKLAKVDILTGDNKHLKDVEITQNANIDDTLYKDRKVFEDKLVGNVFKYWTNEDGQITRMTQVIMSRESGVIADVDYAYDADADRLTDADNRYVASLEDADVIFAVRKNGSTSSSNKGYIQVDGSDYYVDVNDVLAVKQSDIPDINNKDAETTKPEFMDDDNTNLNHKSTWLDRGITPNLGAKFIASIDKNGSADAAILGVDNFNKFGAGTTKIGLVTDVTYANSSDGKYVEVTAAFGGENKTVKSANKVDFDDIVAVYDARQGKDIAVGSETATLDYDGSSASKSGLFDNTSLDNALDKSAAYAEIKTDADGNLLKVTFLDQAYEDTDGDNRKEYAHNKLAGHYFTVSRNVTMGATEKNMSYLLNDGTSKSYDGQTRTAVQFFAGDSNLYSINSLPQDNAKIASDATFYSIDGRPTREDRNYAGKELTVVNGFRGTPDIKAGENYSVITSSSIDRENNDRDAYEIADIVKGNNGDVAAVYAFSKAMNETSAAGVGIVSGTVDVSGVYETITDKNVNAGSTIRLFGYLVDGIDQLHVQGFKVYDSKGVDVTNTFFTGNSAVVLPVAVAKSGVTIAESVPVGTYTVKLVDNNNVVYDNGALTLNVGASTNKYEVQGMTFADFKGVDKYIECANPAVYTNANNKDEEFFMIYVPGAVTFAAGDEIQPNAGVPNMKPENLTITVNSSNLTSDKYRLEKVSGMNGVYRVIVAAGSIKTDDGGAAVTVAPVGTSNVVVDSSKNIKAQGNAQKGTNNGGGSTTPDGGSEAAKSAAHISAGIYREHGGTFYNGTLLVNVTDKNGQEVQGLTGADFSIEVNGRKATIKSALEDVVSGGWKIEVDGVSDWTSANLKTVKVTVGPASAVFSKFAQSAASIEVDSTNSNYKILGKKDGEVLEYTPVLTNVARGDVVMSDAKVDGVPSTDVTWDEAKGVVKVPADILNDLAATKRVTFTLTDPTQSDVTQNCTITIAKQATPKVTSATFDANDMTKLVLTLDTEITNTYVKADLETATWAFDSVGNNDLFPTGTTAPTVKTVSVEGDTVTLTFTQEYKDKITNKETVKVNDTITFPTSLTNVENPTAESNANIEITRIQLVPEFDEVKTGATSISFTGTVNGKPGTAEDAQAIKDALSEWNGNFQWIDASGKATDLTVTGLEVNDTKITAKFTSLDSGAEEISFPSGIASVYEWKDVPNVPVVAGP